MSPPESEPPGTRSPLCALTGLRFVAAFWVVLFHFFRHAKLGFAIPASAAYVLGSGFCGVSLFFALSGFVLSYVHSDIDARDPIAKRNFWAARFARIYPIHLVGFVLAMPFIVLHRMMRGLKASLCAVSGLAIILAATAAGKWIAIGFLHNGLLIPAFCLLIYGLACNGWPAPILSGRLMQSMGDAKLFDLRTAALRLVVQPCGRHAVRAHRLYRLGLHRHYDGQLVVLPGEQRDLDCASILLFKYVETPSRTYLRSRLSWPHPDASSYARDQLRRADAATS